MLDAERLLKAGYLALCHGDTKTLLTEKGSRPRRKRLVQHTSPEQLTSQDLQYLVQYLTSQNLQYSMQYPTSLNITIFASGCTKCWELRHQLEQRNSSALACPSPQNRRREGFLKTEYFQEDACVLLANFLSLKTTKDYNLLIQAFIGWGQLQRRRCPIWGAKCKQWNSQNQRRCSSIWRRYYLGYQRCKLTLDEFPFLAKMCIVWRAFTYPFSVNIWHDRKNLHRVHPRGNFYQASQLSLVASILFVRSSCFVSNE